MRARWPLLIAAGIALVPAAVAADAWDQTAMFEAPGEVSTPAQSQRRMQVTPTESAPPRPSTRDVVNGFTYQHYNDGPAMQAFVLVATERGWSPDLIRAWQPFVHDVMLGESAFCPNRIRGDVVAPYSNCVITRQGHHEDAGFGQVTASWYGQGAILCQKYGVCSRATIVASPYNSMLYSIVIPIEEAGKQSWCYSARARAYHPTCASAPE